MNLNKSQKGIFLGFLFCFYFLAWMMQSQLLLKGDVSWQMHLSRSILAGGNYVKDFFEINPPLSIYLYMPAVILQKACGLSAIESARIYIFLLATLSLIICYGLAKKIFLKNDYLVSLIFLFSLFFVYLILPASEFGQRECLLLYLTMPYFLLISLRLTHKTISSVYAVGIGVLAGIGFAIKPFFLLTFVLVELYFLLQKTKDWKSLLNLLRPEIFSIISFFLLLPLRLF